MIDKHIIYGIHIMQRVKDAPQIQKLLTEYGCNIKSRIGLHHVDANACSPAGLILLEMFGDEAQCQELFDKLAKIGGIEVKEMIFEHPVDDALPPGTITKP